MEEMDSDTYGLDLSRDGIQRIAEECRREGRIAPELREIVRRLTELAASWPIEGRTAAHSPLPNGGSPKEVPHAGLPRKRLASDMRSSALLRCQNQNFAARLGAL